MKNEESSKIAAFKQKNGNSYDILVKEINGCLGCSSIKELDIWYDDEFLVKEEKAVPSLIIKNSKSHQITDWDIVLCNQLVFTSSDDFGETISLTDEALEIIKNFKLASLGTHLVWIYENYKTDKVRY